MMEFFTEFLSRYYIDPIKYSTGYNFVNSLTYAIFFIGAIYLIFIFLNRSKIPVDKKFLIAVFPYVILGSFVRILEDAQIVTNYILVTPVIWGIFLFGILFLLFTTRLIERKFNIPYYKTMFLISIILLAFPITFLSFNNFYVLFLVSVFFLPWVLLSFLIKWSIVNKLVVLSHIFDATASAVAITSFNFFEQYPIPRFLSGIHPIVYIIVKASIVAGILILIDRTSKDKNYNNYLKFIITVLGFAPGLRNLLSMIVLL